MSEEMYIKLRETILSMSDEDLDKLIAFLDALKKEK